MNEILKKRIEEAARERQSKLPYCDDRKVRGEYVGYLKGFIEGAKYALSHQWISIDEALPDDNEIALFIDQYGSMQLLTMNDIRAQNKILDAMLMGVPRGLLDESIVLLDKIVAWMPIPELNLK